MEKYNGWSNYPTWNINLWLGNDEALYETALDLTRTAIANNTDTEYALDGEEDDEGTETFDRDGAIDDLTEALEQMAGEFTPELAGFASDIFTWAMGHVDWREIAASHIDDEVGA